MTFKEQIIGLLKPSKYFPRISLRFYIIVIGYPIAMYYAYKEYNVEWIETKANLAECSSIFERTRNKRPNYIYYQKYQYQADQKAYYLKIESSYFSLDSCQKEINRLMSNNTEMTIWYDNSQPEVTKYKDPKNILEQAIIPTGLTIITFLLFRWLLLSAYKTERP